MAITESDVRHVALLARLALTDGQVTTLAGELSSVLGHIDELQNLELADVQPTEHPLEITNAVRADVVHECLPRALALRNAPASDGRAFLIPAFAGAEEES